MVLNLGEKVAIVACSNPLQKEYESKFQLLTERLGESGLIVVQSKYLYSMDETKVSFGKEKAEELMSFFLDNEIKAIFDISGGNLANEVIGWLDYESIKRNPKPMFGYSDLTCVLNAIYAKAGITTYLYQIRNIMYQNEKEQMQLVEESIIESKETLYQFPIEWIRGHKMEGVAVGGNIRCFLKLAGTPYLPDLQGKILVLESYSGNSKLMITYLNQLKLMGAFEAIQGILLGTFTEMEQENHQPTVEQILLDIIQDPNLPIAKTKYIGHGVDSRCIRIGEYITL